MEQPEKKQRKRKRVSKTAIRKEFASTIYDALFKLIEDYRSLILEIDVWASSASYPVFMNHMTHLSAEHKKKLEAVNDSIWQAMEKAGIGLGDKKELEEEKKQ